MFYANYKDDKRHLSLSDDKIRHCREVAEMMYDFATFFDVNPDVAYFIGLNHDIGYVNGRQDHAKNGYEFLSKTCGIEDQSILNAIRYHGTSPLKVKESVTISPEMQLLWIADMSVNAKGMNVGFEGRLEDIKERYGEDSVAYQTAKETVEYSQQIFREKCIAPKNSFDFNNIEVKKDGTYTVSIKDESKGFNPLGHFDTENILKREFHIDPTFVEKYDLPIPNIKFNFVVMDKEVKKAWIYFENSEQDEKWFYTTLLHYLKDKNTAKVYETMGVENCEKPIEWFRELKHICEKVLSGIQNYRSSHYVYVDELDSKYHTDKIHKEVYKEYLSEYLEKIHFFDKDLSKDTEDVEEELDDKDER